MRCFTALCFPVNLKSYLSSFPAPKNDRTPGQRARAAILGEMERQAANAWYSTAPVVLDAPDFHWQRRPIAAYDFLAVEIPPAPYLAPALATPVALAPATGGL